MRFWDSSAIVPLLAPEPSTPSVQALLSEDGDLTVWWGTPVECTSAVARRERLGAPADAVAATLQSLAELVESWAEVPPTDRIRATGSRLLRVHELRAADALQLAAALVASDDRPGLLPFVTLDERLAYAASREGFPILPRWP